MKITIQTLASDTRDGTESHAVGSETEAQDWLLCQVGEDRDALDAWAGEEGRDPDDDFWDFMSAHQGDLDTFNWDEATVDVDLCGQPLPDSGRQQVAQAIECLRRARDLIKAAGNKQTLATIRRAIDSAEGAARIQIGREQRALRAAEQAGAWARLKTDSRDSNPFHFHREAEQRAYWFGGWDKADGLLCDATLSEQGGDTAQAKDFREQAERLVGKAVQA